MYLAPDYTFRILNTHPEYVGLGFHKAFRAIYKLPKWLDRDLHCTAEDTAKFGPWACGRVNTPAFLNGQAFTESQNPDGSTTTAEQKLVFHTDPFIPKYGFQDCFHRLKNLIITSDLPSAGECSMNGEATYRILTDFSVTHSTGMIETSAAKKSYLNTDNNYISEIPPGNITYACPNGTHGRLILLRGSYPLHSCLVSVITHSCV